MNERFITFLLCLVAMISLSAQDDNDYLRYGIPSDAKKIGPGNTREPNKKFFNYFLPGLEVDRKNLIARELYDGDQLVERLLYKNGVEHGVQRQWHRNGQLSSEAPYKNGMMHGTFRHWNDGGQLIGQYEIINGNGTRKIYNTAGELVREEAIANGRGSGLRMEVSPDGATSLIWQKKGQIIGNSFSFYSDVVLSSVICSSAEGFLHGPRVDFSRGGTVTTKQWFVNNKEVTESEYAATASSDPSLPAYFADATKYKEFVDAEVKALLEKFRKLPPVKIPLDFDQAGNPVLAR